MVVRPWGNEDDPWQETYILYDLGVCSPPRAVNSEASARERGQGELSLSSSEREVLVTQERVTILIGLASHRTLIIFRTCCIQSLQKGICDSSNMLVLCPCAFPAHWRP